jgi:hypothetical protein
MKNLHISIINFSCRSNCDSEAADLLRRHYSRPYFLPVYSESSRTDWIFIGTSGLGAHMHVDHVGLPSWQAQIRGQKLWSLEPPPECFYQCQPMEVIVKTGDTSNNAIHLLNFVVFHLNLEELKYQVKS